MQTEIKDIDARISAKVDSIAIPELPPDMEKKLEDIFNQIPDEADFQQLAQDINEMIAQGMASMEGVKQKALYDWMNKNEKAFGGLDEESQALAVSQMDLTSMAMQELANIKMSPTQAKKTPFMAAGLNVGKVAMAQIMAQMKQGAQGQGGATIQGQNSPYNPGFNP